MAPTRSCTYSLCSPSLCTSLFSLLCCLRSSCSSFKVLPDEMSLNLWGNQKFLLWTSLMSQTYLCGSTYHTVETTCSHVGINRSVPLKTCMLKPCPPVWLYSEMESLGRQSRLNEVIKGDFNPVWLVSLHEEEETSRVYNRRKSTWGSSEWGHLYASKRGHTRNQPLLALWSWTSSFQNDERINF